MADTAEKNTDIKDENKKASKAAPKTDDGVKAVKKAAAKPAEKKTAAEPAPQAEKKEVEKSAQKLAAKPAEKKTAAEPASQATQKKAEKPAQKPASAAQPTAKPVAKTEPAKQVKITLIKSASGRLTKQQKTLKALGLTKINSSVIHNDSEALRGMVFVVKHLVKTEEI